MYSIGLMSGTSMDGIDAALIKTDGKANIIELGHYSLSYDDEFRLLLKIAEFSVRTHEGSLEKAKAYFPLAMFDYLQSEFSLSTNEIKQRLVDLSRYFHNTAHQLITLDQIIRHSTQLHAQLVNNLLQHTKLSAGKIDVIGYHGQALFHRPSTKITIQVGDGSLLAKLTGITVINDFRIDDVNAGGQGAPLAPLYHQALAIRDKKYPCAIVNCGGISNVTVISGSDLTDVIGFDTGPGNGLIDRCIRQRTQGKEQMDADGQYGKQGIVHEDMLDKLYAKAVTYKNINFFDKKPPKSLDIGDLILISELDHLSLPDVCRTLEAFTADSIVNSLRYFPGNTKPIYWILAGGGWHNPVILQELKERLSAQIDNVKIITADEAGWNSQALEAQIFAYLAVRSLNRLPLSVPNTTGVSVPLCGGYMHKPDKSETN